MGSGGGASERRGAEERTLTGVVQTGAAPAAACGAAMRAAEPEVAPRAAAAIAAAVAERPMARSCTARRAQRMALRGSRGRSI